MLDRRENKETGDVSLVGCAQDVAVVTAPAHPPPLAIDRARQAAQAYVALGVVGFAVASLGGSIVLAARDIHVDEARLGWLASAFGIGLVAVGGVGTRLLQRGPQSTLRAGAVLLAVGAALVAVAPNVVTAVIGGLLAGLGAAGLVLVTPVLLAGPDATTRYSRGTAVSSTTGVLAPAALGAVDLTGVTGRTALLILVVPLVLLARSARPDRADGLVPAPVDDVRDACPDRVGFERRWVAIVLAVAVEFCFVVWGVGRLRETGISAGAAAALASAFPIGLAVGRVAAPGLIRRGWPPISVGALVTAVGTLMLVASGSATVATTALAVAGLGVASFYPVLLAGLMALPDISPWRATSLATFASGTAILTAPAVLGLLGQSHGLRASFLVTVPLLAALVLVAGRTRERPILGRVVVGADDRSRL